jgi:hypothetical protein
MQFPPAFVERIQHQFPQDFKAFFDAGVYFVLLQYGDDVKSYKFSK